MFCLQKPYRCVTYVGSRSQCRTESAKMTLSRAPRLARVGWVVTFPSPLDQVCPCLQLWGQTGGQGRYAEFLLKIILKFLLGKTSARLNLKIKLNSLHIGSDVYVE